MRGILLQIWQHSMKIFQENMETSKFQFYIPKSQSRCFAFLELKNPKSCKPSLGRNIFSTVQNLVALDFWQLHGEPQPSKLAVYSQQCHGQLLPYLYLLCWMLHKAVFHFRHMHEASGRSKLVKNWWLFFPELEHMMFTIYTSVHHFPSALSHQPTLYRSTTTRSLNQHKNSEILDA